MTEIARELERARDNLEEISLGLILQASIPVSKEQCRDRLDDVMRSVLRVKEALR
jgi:hypothetical protein